MIFISNWKWSATSFAAGLMGGVLMLPFCVALKHLGANIYSGKYKDLDASSLKVMLTSKTYAFGNYFGIESDANKDQKFLIIKSKSSESPSIGILQDKKSGDILGFEMMDATKESVFIQYKNPTQASGILITKYIDGKKLFAIDHGVTGVYDFRSFDGVIDVLVDGQLYRGKMINHKLIVQKDGHSYLVTTNKWINTLTKIQ